MMVEVVTASQHYLLTESTPGLYMTLMCSCMVSNISQLRVPRDVVDGQGNQFCYLISMVIGA